MKLTDEQIDKIVDAVYPVPHSDMGALRLKLTRAFGERKNPYEAWNGHASSPLGRVATLFDAAAKVADGCDADGYYSDAANPGDNVDDRAALKKIVEEIRGMQ